MKKLITALSVTSTALFALHAQAWEPGNLIVRAGVATVSPDAGSDGIAIPALGIEPIGGTSVDVGDDTQLGLTLTYMYTSDFGVEVLAATPFTHSITADLNAAGLGVAPVGETSHLPPTVSAVWYPMGSRESFKPYLGAGINYTTFFDTSVSATLEGVVGDLAGLSEAPQLDMDLDDSLGLALQAGFDYAIDEAWHMNASIRWIDINSEATITNSALGKVITVNNVEIDPWVYQVNIGYKF